MKPKNDNNKDQNIKDLDKPEYTVSDTTTKLHNIMANDANTSLQNSEKISSQIRIEPESEPKKTEYAMVARDKSDQIADELDQIANDLNHIDESSHFGNYKRNFLILITL